MVKKMMREPKVPNKYDLTPEKIRGLKFDRSKIGEPVFWRNNVISAWCITRDTAKDKNDYMFGTYDSFWLGIYDDDAEAYAGKLRFYFDSYGGMCSYEFKKFYNYSEIEYELDLEIQEMALEVLNQLIDDGVLYFDVQTNSEE